MSSDARTLVNNPDWFGADRFREELHPIRADGCVGTRLARTFGGAGWEVGTRLHLQHAVRVLDDESAKLRQVLPGRADYALRSRVPEVAHLRSHVGLVHSKFLHRP